MKKNLSTMFAMIAALLAMPYHAKADTNYHYYLVGDFNNYVVKSNYKFGDTSSTNDKPSFKVTLTGAQLDPNKDGTAKIRIGVTLNDNTDGYYLSHNNYNVTLSRDAKLGVSGTYQTNSLIITEISQSGSYTFTFKSGDGSLGPDTRNQGTISVSGPYSVNTNLKLKGSYSNDNWATSTDYTSFSDGIYTWEFTPTDFPNNTQFKLFDTGTNSWYSNGAAVTEDWSNEFLSENNNMSVSYTANDELIKISVQAKKSNGKWKIRIVKTYEPHDYYWVSPQITNGEMWAAFKMVASRNRYWSGSAVIGDGKISTKYYTFTIKDDDLVTWKTKSKIDKDTPIQWYILRDDGQVVYRPTTDLTPRYLPHENNPYDTNHPISGNTDNDGYVSFINYWNGSSYDGDKAYMTTEAPHNAGSWKFLKGSALAHTFNLNAEKGHVLYNYTNKGASTSRGYKLVGNWTADTKVSIHLSDGKPMTKYWFKGGVGSTTEVAEADSIVYKIDITKKALGIDSWGGLYLDISPSDNGTEDNDTNWGKVFRPLITTGNNLDGRALHGALTTRKDEQSLNPETSENYLGYTFSFNATTMTYRLEFHTSLYLVGPGVSATEGEGSWDLSKVKSSEPSDPRIRLNATQEVGHYRNRVYFTEGKEFRFIQNIDESATPNYKTTWHENGNAPKFRTATTDSEYTPGNETQYKNVLTFQNIQNNESISSTQPVGKSVTFDLPTGWYYVNFYENSDNPYYTIERQIDLRDFSDVKYSNGGIVEKRNILNRGGYNFFRVWSDHIAWTKPADIDVFVVTNFSIDQNGQATAVLTKQDVDYIPAKTGVILASSKTKDSFGEGTVYNEAASGTAYNTAWMDMTPYDAPATTYNGVSKLTPLYDAKNLQRFVTEGNTEYANYLFGFYRLNKVISNYTGSDNDFGLGFWITTGVGDTYPNSAFLRILKSDAEKMGVGTTYNMTGGNHAPVLYLMFEDASASEYTTGIRNDRVQNVSSDEWFTLEGRRVASPTGKGLYIHNGKKVVIR